ncbi:phytoene desaturase family protein [Tundrisphaera sp. TA3]|uniref:phytoene desaturase family protein n=1 Tax=Tundrisphaera sp. TA3 TaxID=3435775 RepID=UPI003EB913B9
MPTPSPQPRVVVIGAGPGGLAISVLLAQAGLSVTILERLPEVGGRTSALEADGFRFDLGSTFFSYPRALSRILAAIGRDLEAEVPMVRLDPLYRLVFGAGGELLATPDLARMGREIARLSPGDAANFPRFLDANRAKLAQLRPMMEGAFRDWRDLGKHLISPAMPRTMMHLRPWFSLEDEVARYFHDPRLRLAFSFQAKYLGMSAASCPSLFSILAFLEYEHGLSHPIGGCSAITRRLAEIAAEMGVAIRTDEPARAILFEGRRAVGVRTDRGVYPADRVVINADFARAMRRLVPEHLRRRWTDRRIDSKRYSSSTFMMYLGLEGIEDRLAHHTFYLAEDYRRNLRDIEVDHRLSDDPSLYVQNACPVDPSLAPPGMSTLQVLAPVTHMHPNVDWAREKGPFRALVLRQLRDRLGVADLERRIRFERVLTPQDWDVGHEIQRGATFNLAHVLGQLLHRRPRNRFEDLDGVYLVGGGTHPGSGLPVIFESARIGGRLLLESLGIDHDWIDAAGEGPARSAPTRESKAR